MFIRYDIGLSVCILVGVAHVHVIVGCAYEETGNCVDTPFVISCNKVQPIRSSQFNICFQFLMISSLQCKGTKPRNHKKCCSWFSQIVRNLLNPSSCHYTFNIDYKDDV